MNFNFAKGELNKVKKNNSLAFNAFYQILYNIIATITPLITTPIVSREMGSNNLGVFSYTLTISHYFTLFAMLGIVNYGTRSIAETDKSKRAVSRTFWSIYSVQFFCALSCNILYLLYIVLFAKDNIVILYVQGFWVLSALLDINWLFFGLEEFKITVSRNIIIKILTVIAIVLFVKKEHNPLFIYTMIMAGGNFISVAAILPLIKGKIEWYMPDSGEIITHIKPILILFIPLLAGVLFGSIDKVMLGGKSEYDELGYYYNADRVINIPLGVINGLSAVFFPRISAILVNNKKRGLSFISKSYGFISWTSVLLAFGIAGCAKEFVPVFFGNGYEKCIVLIYIMTPILILNALCIFYRMQFLVPFHYDKLYAIALFIGSIVNVILNAVLIPQYKSVGASIATLVAQFIVMIIQFKEHNDISLLKWFLLLVRYMIVGGIMIIGMRLTFQNLNNGLIRLLLEIAFGGFLYICLSVGLWWITGDLKDKIALVKGQ